MRLGKEGQPFRLFKFSAMHCDAEHELRRSPELYKRYLTNNYKLPAGEDPRLTTIGGFLRALSIDELPRLINVVKAEMSLVGPRPIVPLAIENYGEFPSLFPSSTPVPTTHCQLTGPRTIQDY